MKSNQKTDVSFYVTSPIFYPNANLHMGHAYTMTICDILVRYHRLLGERTYFLAGSDENTGKVVKVATEKKIPVKTFLNEVTENFKKLYKDLNISNDQFIRTTDKDVHWPGALKMWRELTESGDIYKGTYTGLYCQSCETFYTEKELVYGKCPQHGTVPESIKEENYFFKLSKYTKPIKQKIESGELLIVPETRKNEILALLERGLEDISFSRPIKNVPHGIPVPGNSEQVIYVWCDALVNYISALGYGTNNSSLFEDFWPANVHVIGKDILRFHAAIWPAMLLSAKLPLPKSILVHGLIISNGKKMSKSLGNVIDPLEILKEYGSDALRYFIARELNLFEDSDMTMEGFKSAYNAKLANGLGNLTSRILKMATANGIVFDEKSAKIFADSAEGKTLHDKQEKGFESFNINSATDAVWELVGSTDRLIQENQPFKKIKVNKEEGEKEIKDLLSRLYFIAVALEPIMPDTAKTIQTLIKENKMPEKPLFARKD